MSQCHDRSEYEETSYPAPGPCPAAPPEAGCHDSYDSEGSASAKLVTGRGTTPSLTKA